MKNHNIKKWLLYTAHYLRGEPILSSLDQVTNVERMEKEQLVRYQQNKMFETIRVCLEQGIYEADMGAGILSGENSVREAFSRLPLATKKSIRESHLKEYPVKKRLESRATSGSTGEPLKFKKSRLTTSIMDAVMYSVYKWHGIDLADAQARFWGVPVERKLRLLASLKDYVKNRIRLSAFTLDSNSMWDFYRKLELRKPTSFYGYPSLIYEFALFLNSNDLRLNYDLKVIIGTGEHMDCSQVAVIEETFQSKFVNEYGCTEVGIIGFDCIHGRMHLMAHNIYMEVLKNGKSVVDEEGDIYVTELNSDYLPFVRYNIGDRGKILTEKCPCGLAFPVIQISEGRQDDYILTPEGNRVYDAILAYTFRKGVAQFKAYQSTVDTLDIRIVPEGGELSEEQLRSYKEILEQRISRNIQFRFELVDDIPREKSGKLRYFQSLL